VSTAQSILSPPISVERRSVHPALHPTAHPEAAVNRRHGVNSRAYAMPTPTTSNRKSPSQPPLPTSSVPEAVSNQGPPATVAAAAPLLENPEACVALYFDGTYTPDDSSDFLKWLMTNKVPKTLVRCCRFSSFGPLDARSDIRLLEYLSYILHAAIPDSRNSTCFDSRRLLSKPGL
jgi:hypothetical protein